MLLCCEYTIIIVSGKWTKRVFPSPTADCEKQPNLKYRTMATILNDTELKNLIGTVIKDADQSCVRPNSYILRLGSNGTFINTEKEFKINEKQGIQLAPGHAVGVTALETIDFSQNTVKNIFPECDLHGFISPTTDLSREGIIAASTQIDAGYKGTLNWTLTNTSGKVAEFVHGEKLFRMTIVRLENGERPELLYQGDYQEKQGYVPSRRRGAPKGMKKSDWVDAFVDDGPEGKLEELINSGYPWNILGTRLKRLDDHLKTVTNEYADIRDSIVELNQKMSRIKQTITDTMEDTLRNREDRFILQIIAGFLGFIGALLTLSSNAGAWNWIVNNLLIVGSAFLAVGMVLLLSFKRTK